jgi:hypothetical protein
MQRGRPLNSDVRCHLSEVHMFEAVATASSKNERYSAGERFDLLVLLRQSLDTAHDWEQAEKVLAEAGWVDAEFSRAAISTKPPESITDQVLRDALKHAGEGGSSILVYGGKAH